MEACGASEHIVDKQPRTKSCDLAPHPRNDRAILYLDEPGLGFSRGTLGRNAGAENGAESRNGFHRTRHNVMVRFPFPHIRGDIFLSSD